MGRLAEFNRLCRLSFSHPVGPARRLTFALGALTERLFHGTELREYFQYRFYALPRRARRTYMTHASLRRVVALCNDPAVRPVFDDKALFHKAFAPLMGNDWLDAAEATCEQFSAFVHAHPAFFAKPRRGMFGSGARVCGPEAHRGPAQSGRLFDSLRADDYILEPLIVQHLALARFNPSSVNTVRVVTLLDADGQARVVAAALRLGRAGEAADNFHRRGIAAAIDAASGRVCSPGVDGEFHRFAVHPDSGQPIQGFAVPAWEQILSLARRAARVEPRARYVGWDVAVDEWGRPRLIEGNYAPDPDILQMPRRQGVWPEHERELRP